MQRISDACLADLTSSKRGFSCDDASGGCRNLHFVIRGKHGPSHGSLSVHRTLHFSFQSFIRWRLRRRWRARGRTPPCRRHGMMETSSGFVDPTSLSLTLSAVNAVDRFAKCVNGDTDTSQRKRDRMQVCPGATPPPPPPRARWPHCHVCL